MGNVLLVVKKEFLQLRRDPRIFPILFIAPVIQLVFLGYAATLDVKRVPLLVRDHDRSAASREFVRAVTATDYFTMLGSVSGYEEIGEAMREGHAVAAIVIPAGYQRELRAGRSVSVQAVIDGSDSNQATIAQNYLSMIAWREGAEVLAGRLMSSGVTADSEAMESRRGVAARIRRMAAGGEMAVSAEPRVFHNPEMISRNFMIPGVVVMVLLVITTMLTSLAVVREKETGAMEQLIVTPIKPWQFIAGKLLPFIIIGYIEVTLVAMVAVFWFEVPFHGSPAALYAYSGLFLLTTLGFGLFISTVSNNQQQAMITAFFIMFTMMLLSGFMFPIENMPEPVQWFTLLIPMRYFLVIIRSVFLKGSGLEALWPQALGLLVIGVTVIGLSVRRFSKTLD